jgi:dTDP-glucose 4,6-dehydratase
MRLCDGRAIPAFITQALNNEPITVFGNGLQTRSVCYVSDLIDGIYKLLLSNENEPVNIGNPDEITILDLAKEIIELTILKVKLFLRFTEDDPKVRQPDIDKARSILGWEPKVSRREGLINTIEDFKKDLKCNIILNSNVYKHMFNIN